MNPKNKESSPREFFLTLGVHPRKSLGQSFMRDQQVLKRICLVGEVSPQDEILEIGAGLGALTVFLGERARRVIAVERDKRLLMKLKKNTSHLKNIEVVEGDFLKLNLSEILSGEKIKVVSNLPYSISSPILLRLLRERSYFSLIIVTLQREVGRRTAAPPGGKERGSISVLMQTYMDVSIEFYVPPQAFWPMPKVSSVVVKLKPLSKTRVPITDEKLFEKIVRAAFSSRRKTLQNCLSNLFRKETVEETLKAVQIDGKRRAETLSVEEFGSLYRAFVTIQPRIGTNGHE